MRYSIAPIIETTLYNVSYTYSVCDLGLVGLDGGHRPQ